MILSNLRAHATFLTILLVFCCFIAHSAVVDTDGIPEAVTELLSGKTTDFTGVATQIPEHQLPTALAAAKLLKFRALHGETSLSSNEADAFETILLDRMSTAQQVAFSQNETCRKKIEQHEIMFDGQKLLVPAHFVADTNLTVISYQPKGEAGSLFPDFNIEVFSQSPLTEITLAINGQAINAKSILIKQSANAFALSYRTPATPDSLLSIGTYTAEITINNQSGETAKQQWSFTVGIYNVPTPPLPADVKVIGEIMLPGDKLLPGQKLSGSLRAVIYEDTAGNRYIEYQLTTASGQIIKSRNLAFIGRKMLPGRAGADDIELSPKTTHAFIGNALAFSYAWTGLGQVLSTDWLITSGNISTTENSVKMAGNTSAKCTIVVEETYTDNAGNQTSFQYEVSAFKTILALEIFANISSNRMLLVSNNATASFALKSMTDCIVNYSNETGLLQSDLAEGKVYTFNSGATLKAERLHWKIYAEEGSPKVKDPVATTTQLLFAKPGFAELVLDVKLVWQQYGETYESDFKPETSGLYAFYPVKGSAQFNKYPQGQLSVAARHIAIESFEFEIKQQKRIITAPENTELDEPIHICSSALWPASSPIMVFKAIPLIFNAKTGREIETVEPFVFQTPMVISDDSIELNLGGEFHSGEMSSQTCRTVIGRLPTIPVYDENEVLQLQLQPADKVTIYEGQEQIFKAEVAPLPGFGHGVYSDVSQTLDVLNGYEVSSVEHVLWYEEPLGDEGGWKSKALRGLDFSHVFKPFIGPGSYTMNCGIVMNLIETDSADEVLVYLENVVPVDALPGLRIFSPINELAYPVNVSLKVKTSFDKDPKIWETIKWRLNGKEFKPGAEAPFFIDLNRTGKWSLQAELTIKNPQTGEDMPLKDRVDFIVNPVEISLTPTRKVFDLSKQKSQELSLNITLNGKKVEKPGKPVEWNDDGLKAVVDPVEWFSATVPNGCATANHDENSLTANVGFNNAGAATLLATVTVRLVDGEDYFRRRHKGFEDEFEEPIFAFPAARADLWAVSASPLKEVKGLFPEKAIAQAYRTYQIESFEFDFYSEQRQLEKYTLVDGLKPPIVIGPALAGVASVSASINFAWEVISDTKIEKEVEAPTKLVIKPSALCDYKVVVEPMLDFGSAGKIQLGKIETAAKALSLFDLIETKVDPASFTITLGEPKTLKYVVKTLETPPVKEPVYNSAGKEVIYLLNNSFALEIEKVEWSHNQTPTDPQVPAKGSVISSSYDFNAFAPGSVDGNAKGYLKITEIYEGSFAHKISNFTKDISWFAYILDIIVKLFGNDELISDSSNYYFGQQVKLAFKLFNSNNIEVNHLTVDKPYWQVEEPAIAAFNISSDFSRASYISWNGNNATSTSFYVFDYDQEKTSKAIDFKCEIYTPDFHLSLKRTASALLKYKKPTVIEQTFDYKAPRVATHPVTGVWTLGFDTVTKPGIRFYQKILNETGKTYDFNSMQLIKIDCTREIASGPTIIKESLKTFVIHDSPSTSDFWLDAGSPPQRFPTGLNRPVESSTEFASISVFNDSPYVDLKVGTKDIRKVSARMEFQQFVLAKISQSDFPYFPIGKKVLWSWEGAAIKKDDQTWEKLGELVSPTIEMFTLDSFPNWYEKSSPDNPKWVAMEDTNE